MFASNDKEVLAERRIDRFIKETYNCGRMGKRGKIIDSNPPQRFLFFRIDCNYTVLFFFFFMLEENASPREYLSRMYILMSDPSCKNTMRM